MAVTVTRAATLIGGNFGKMAALPMKNQPFGARLGFAMAGLRWAIRAERSLRSQLTIAVAVLLALCLVRPPPIWWAVILLAMAAVLTAELLNTALERLIDHLQPAIHPEIQVVKDCAAAAVLVMAGGAVCAAAALAVSLAIP